MPQGEVGSFRKSSRRVDKPPAAGLAVAAIQVVSVVSMADLHLLRATLQAAESLVPSHPVPRFGVVLALGQKRLTVRR